MQRLALRWIYLAICLSTWATSGCQLALGGLEVQTVKSSVQKPSNVAVYVAIMDGDQPLTGLGADNFQVFENDNLIERSQSQLSLVERELVALHHTLLLVDLSGKLSDTELSQLTKALESFVSEITKTQSVAVYGFDGREKIWKLGEFERGDTDKPSFKALEGGDPSRNLHGAVVLALQQLDANLMRIKKPVRVGTLAVFARGQDVAGRQTIDALQSALDASSHAIVTLGIEAEDTAYIDDIGRSGNVKTTSMGSIEQGFRELGNRLNAAYGSYYLVQYCSPARAGTPTMRLEVRNTTKDGEERSGDLELGFDASGFGPGCDPNATPTFKVALQDPWDMSAQPEPDAEPQPDPAPTESEPSPHPKAVSSPSNEATSTPTGAAGTDDDEDDNIVPPPDKPGYE